MAASLAAEIKREMALETECVAGTYGVYEVHLGEKLIFSKSAAGDRFPKKGEVIQLLKDAGVGA
ncbi:MAG: Rdx family protein [Nitrospinota bacterium]|nr:Rdx family protein [Nitrospinota bacterium]